MLRLLKYSIPIIALGIGHLALHSSYTMDDAYISFRYASNLADGVGLVHNPGEYVKGYSNTIWTCLMVLPESLGLTPLYFAKTLGAASFGLVLFVLLHFARESFVEWPVPRANPQQGRQGGKAAMQKRRSGRQGRSTRKRRLEAESQGSANRSQRDSQLTGAPARSSHDTGGSGAMVIWQLFPAALLVLSAPVAVWFINGMETGFYTAMVVAAVLMRLREQRADRPVPWSALPFILAIWCRPEGIIFFAAMALHDAAYRIVKRQISVGDICWYVLPIGAYLLELLWSKAYYGAYLPNTYYAKVEAGDTTGSLFSINLTSIKHQLSRRGYFARNIWECGGYAVVALGLLAIFRKQRLRQNAALLLMVVAQFAFLCRVGGDWMPASRFIVPIIPFLILLTGEALFLLTCWTKASHRKFVGPAFCLLVIGLFIPGNYRISQYVFHDHPVAAKRLLEEGRFIASLAGPGRSFSSYDIGGQGYAAPMNVIDTWGLTDRFIGKWRFVDLRACAEYLMLRQPDVIRRHKSHRKDTDEALYHAALDSGQYLRFPNDRYLIRKDLVFVNEAPSFAAIVPDTEESAGLLLDAIQLPRVVTPKQTVDGVLYWKHARRKAGGQLTRRLFLRDQSGESLKIDSPCISEQIDLSTDWPAGASLADFITFPAPDTTGKYTLTVEYDGAMSGQAVTTIDVLARDEALESARSLLAEVRRLDKEDDRPAALDKCRTAALLSDRQARTMYVDVATRYANELQARARSKSPRGAMSLLNEARWVLHRTFYDLGGASDELRRAIDGLQAEEATLFQSVFSEPTLDLTTLDSADEHTDADARPNIILIGICSCRYANLGIGGNPRATSPFIDALAQHGVLFENDVGAASWTKPSVASVLTGLTPNVHGMTDHYDYDEIGRRGFKPKRVLADHIVTLAECLSEAGYATMSRNNSIHVGQFFNMVQGFDDAANLRQEYETPKMLDDFADWLAEQAPSQPIFFFLFMRDIHSPYMPPYDYYLRYCRSPNPIPRDMYRQYLAGLRVALNQQRKNGEPITEEQKQTYNDIYEADIAYLDDALSEIPKILQWSGRLSNTVIVLTADHGERFFSPHGPTGHMGGFMGQEIVHNPLVFWGKGMPAGTRIKDVVRSIDIYPTLAELAGANVPPVVQGRSLLPLIRGDASLPETSAFASFGGVDHMVRLGRYKYHYRANQEPTLYDVESDPGELNDLAEAHPTIAARMQSVLDSWLQQEETLREVVPQGGTRSVTPEVLEQLEALGYINNE